MRATVELEKLSNEDLAQECVRRPVDEDSWRVFWQRFHPFVYRKVLYLLAPFSREPVHNEVEDIVQLVFLRLFEGLSRFDRQKSPLTAYLSLMTTSIVTDQLRSSSATKRSRRNTQPLDELKDFGKELPMNQVEAVELWHLVVHILESLDSRDQAVIREVLSGDSRAVVAKRHAISLTNVYTIVYRFRQVLREAIEGTAR